MYPCSRLSRHRSSTVVRPILVLCKSRSVQYELLGVVSSHSLIASSHQASSSILGIVDFLSISFAILSDVIPQEFRTPGYGVLLSAVYGSFAFAPSLALVLNSVQLAVVSFLLMVTSFLVALAVLPETISEQVQQENYNQHQQRRQANNQATNESSYRFSTLRRLVYGILTRPFREMAILNRSWLLRLVTAGSFLSSMVFASDATLIAYYIEDELNVRRADFASLFFVGGIAGIVVQLGLVQPLVRLLGDRKLLVVTFMCGTLHNFVYGMAKSKSAIYVAFVVAQLTKVNFAVASSLASQGVTGQEQGRIQGALFATNAMANALGPLSMELIYNRTKNTILGPGFMWFCASGLYAIGTFIVSFIPEQKHTDVAVSDLEEPLLLESGVSAHDNETATSTQRSPENDAVCACGSPVDGDDASTKDSCQAVAK
jgi:hypothetical protein